jgi:hypothetical protein
MSGTFVPSSDKQHQSVPTAEEKDAGLIEETVIKPVSTIILSSLLVNFAFILQHPDLVAEEIPVDSSSFVGSESSSSSSSSSNFAPPKDPVPVVDNIPQRPPLSSSTSSKTKESKRNKDRGRSQERSPKERRSGSRGGGGADSVKQRSHSRQAHERVAESSRKKETSKNIVRVDKNKKQRQTSKKSKQQNLSSASSGISIDFNPAAVVAVTEPLPVIPTSSSTDFNVSVSDYNWVDVPSYDDSIDIVPAGINNIVSPTNKALYMIRTYDPGTSCIDSLFHLLRGNVNLVLVDPIALIIACLTITNEVAKKEGGKKERDFLRLRKCPIPRKDLQHLVADAYINNTLNIMVLGRILSEIMSSIPEMMSDSFESFEYRVLVAPLHHGPYFIVYRRHFNVQATILMEQLLAADTDTIHGALINIHIQRKLMGLSQSNWDFTDTVAHMFAEHNNKPPDQEMVMARQITRDCDRMAARLISQSYSICYSAASFLQKQGP